MCCTLHFKFTFELRAHQIPVRRKRILLVQGHPDTAGRHLCHALADEYSSAATAAGHQVDAVAPGETDFPLLRSQRDWMRGATGVPEQLANAQRLLTEADHVVIFFPLWLGTMPALLKGYLEQILRPGVALSYDKTTPRPLLSGKSARLIVTMGMPGPVYRWYFGAHGVRNLKRSILGITGIRKVRADFVGLVDNFSPARYERWSSKMQKLGRQSG